MYKKIKGYFTVEAVYLIPIILLLYVLIIISGFYLYDRCVMSQDSYLLAFRGGHFTDYEENEGTVIYAEMQEKIDENYIMERMAYKTGFYPYFGEEDVKVYVQDEVITVSLSGFEELLYMNKSVLRQNPLKGIKNVRRQKQWK